jgi:hypothetical protein
MCICYQMLHKLNKSNNKHFGLTCLLMEFVLYEKYYWESFCVYRYTCICICIYIYINVLGTFVCSNDNEN